MKTLVAMVLVAASLLVAESAAAFGRQGHRIICEAAYRLLSPAAQERVDLLLEAIPAEHRAAVNRDLRNPEDHRLTFADSCVWPDVVKRGEEYDATYEWHFINVQRRDREVELDDCMVGCLLTGIDVHSAILTAPLHDWPRAQALMFLGHWVADIHQPMHVSFGDDRGGNGTPVRVPSPGGEIPEDSCDDLHTMWDYCIIEHNRLSEEEMVAGLAAEARTLTDPRRGNGTPVDWANESLALSRSTDVGYCRMEGEECAPYPVPDGGTRVLPHTYYADSWPTLERRMALAAMRLASRLEDLLAAHGR